MKVFVSWSQPTSHKIAESIKEELSYIFNGKVEFWYSEEDIGGGGIAFSTIISALQESDMIIVCLDSSNYNKPWIYFESGFVFGKEYPADEGKPVIFPIVFDDLKFDTFKSTPFTNIQLRKFSKKCLKEVLKRIDEIHKAKYGDPVFNPEAFQRFLDVSWSNLSKRVNNIIVQRTDGGNSMITEENVTDLIARYGNFPTPTFGPVIMYSSGFETNYFYDFLLENVQKRLYIFGRKNSKLRNRSYNVKFQELQSKKVDLKMLFLNPNSEYAQGKSAQDTADFRTKLITSIKDHYERFQEQKLDISDYCRMYDEKRTSEIIVADNVVFYKDLAYSDSGSPLHFTNASFSIISVDSTIGSDYFRLFEKVWNQCESTKITSSFLETL